MGGGGSKQLPREDFPHHKYSHNIITFLTEELKMSSQDMNELYNMFRKMSPQSEGVRVTFEEYFNFLCFEKKGRFLKTMVMYFSRDQCSLTFPGTDIFSLSLYLPFSVILW